MVIETSRTIVKIPSLDTRGRTIVVAASNTINPYLAPAAYHCDGTNDQVEINAAITALGAIGGTVMLLEGTYNITASINLATLTTLMGQGAGTVLRVPNGHDADLNVISVVNANRVIVADLRIDGNRANQTAGDMNGIYFDTVTYSTIARCWVENMAGGYVFDTAGITLSASDNNTVTSNNVQSNGYYGIYLYASSNNTVAGNNIQSNGNTGIYFFTSSDNNTVTGNNIQSNAGSGITLRTSCDNNTITGNNCQSNDGTGVDLVASSNNTISGNNCQGNDINGIALAASSNNTISGNYCQSPVGNAGILLDTNSNNNTVTGNNCQGNDDYGINVVASSNNTITGNNCQSSLGIGIGISASDNNTIAGNNCQSNGYVGIWLEFSNNNTITGNTVVGNSQALDNTYDGIIIDNNSDYNNVQGNTVRHAGGANQHRYGIRINNANCDGNLVIDNDLYQAGRTLDYSDAGTLTIYHNNRITVGWVP